MATHDSATPNEVHAEVDHRSLQVPDRVVDMLDVPLEPGERVLDDVLGCCAVERDRSREAEQALAMIEEEPGDSRYGGLGRDGAQQRIQPSAHRHRLSLHEHDLTADTPKPFQIWNPAVAAGNSVM
ncbi:MAG: hypothetical protein JWL72_1716 [Ilumatobacteraceae bacterium]|nr:hypothetical protein [Ilumatobacteraceae bacterium]